MDTALRQMDFAIAIFNVWRVTIQAALEAFLLIPCHILDGDTGWERKGEWTERMLPLPYPSLLQSLAEEGRPPVLLKALHRAVDDGTGSRGCPQKLLGCSSREVRGKWAADL